VPREDLEAIITGDLLALIEVARQVIAERQHLPGGAPSLKVVGHGRCGCEERVEVDPVPDGFAGVLFELLFDGQRYVLAETALGTGGRRPTGTATYRRARHSKFGPEEDATYQSRGFLLRKRITRSSRATRGNIRWPVGFSSRRSVSAIP
jgi:hypothetical protein